MCNFFSGLYTRTGDLLWHWCTDHHSELMRIFGLKDDREQYFVRVEFLPPSDLATVADVATWQFKLDEERTPGWFDDDAKADAIKKLGGVIASHIVSGERDVLVDGPWILIDGANVSTILAGRIALISGKPTIQNAGSATIQYAGSATIQNAGSATIQVVKHKAGKAVTP